MNAGVRMVVETTGMSSKGRVQLLSFKFPDALGTLTRSQIAESQVHLWTGDSRQAEAEQFTHLLSADEKARAVRFHFDPDRNDFGFARGMMRVVLGSYLGADPEDIDFSYSEHGKPALACVYAEAALRFNLSHTQGSVLMAICRDREVGVDIERVREDVEAEEIAAQFFSMAEREALMDLPREFRAPAFFRCWTRKEAFLKARGHGLSFPLERFDVSIGAGETAVRLTTRPDPAEAQRWQILQAPAPEGCAAAVAVASSPQSDSGGEANGWS